MYQPVKERYSDKVVSFYRSFNSTQAELKFVVSSIHHRTLADVLDDVCRRVFLGERERFLHTSEGTILNSIEEFEDGGIYFFGPPHIFDINDYMHFQKTNSPLQSVSNKNDKFQEEELKVGGSRKAGSRQSNHMETRSSRSMSEVSGRGGPPARSQKRRRLIKVTVNHDPHTLCSFVVDEVKHRAIGHILNDLSIQLHYRRDQFSKLITSSGKPVSILIHYIKQMAKKSFQSKGLIEKYIELFIAFHTIT